MGSLPRPAMGDGTLAWQSPQPDVTGNLTLLATGPPPSRDDPWDTLANHLRVVLGSILAGPWMEDILD